MGLNETLASIGGMDDQTLKNSYYDFLGKGLSPDSYNYQVDDTSALVRGILPTLATAFLTKGKALAYAGEPLANTLKGLEADAKEKAKFAAESNLTSAKLIGDEVQSREKIKADRFALSEKLQQQELDRQSREDIAAENRASREDISREGMALRRDMGSMMAGSRNERQNDLNDSRAVSEEDRVIDDFRKDSTDYVKAKKNVNSLMSLSEEALKNPDEAQATQSTIAGLAVQIAQGSGRVSDKDIALYKNDSAYSNIAKLKNWVNGGAQGTMPEASVSSIKKMASILNNKLMEDYKGRVEQTYLDRAGTLRFGNPDNVKKFISSSSPFKNEMTQEEKMNKLGELLQQKKELESQQGIK